MNKSLLALIISMNIFSLSFSKVPCGGKSYNTHDWVTLIAPTCPVIARAQKANSAGKHYTHKLSLNGTETTVISFFNHTYNLFPLQDSFASLSREKNPTSFTIDLRPYEVNVCKKAMASVPRHIKHRGTIGLAAGLLTGAALAATSGLHYSNGTLKKIK